MIDRGDLKPIATANMPSDAIAIVGMAGRFPGSSNIRGFWKNVCGGVDSISHFAPEELRDAFPAEIRSHRDFVPARGVLADVERFDPAFFGIRPRDAALTDPQHRLFLECAWEALEDAGYDHASYRGSVGVFGGCSLGTYLLRNVLGDRAAVERFASEYQVGMYSELLGGLTDTLATRVAYRLNLKGPATTVHTACSTSLYAVTLACQSLALFQCDMAIAGGVSVTFPQERGYLHNEGGMVSRDGRCRPFDADASGTVFSSGAGAVLLKRLEDALSDGDHIYAVVRGFGVNNDGSDKAGFAAPSADGQAGAIIQAHAAAQIEPASIGYLEAHGTATPLGDPIEFSGLLAAFASPEFTSAARHCALGSVKANIGHTDAAAGVIALIKAALCIEHATIPPLAHFKRPNPHIQLEGSPFYIPTERSVWPASAAPRRAGVSSFGVGGANVHVVLEQAPPRSHADDSERVGLQLLPLSAKTPAALEVQREQLARHLESQPDPALVDVAYTLQHGRRGFSQRWFGSARSREQAIAALRAPGKTRAAEHPPERVVFLFPGQGAQFSGMGRALYESDPLVREEIDRAATRLQPLLESDIRHAMFASPDSAAGSNFEDTHLVQPALFVLTHALAKLWERIGVRPDAMVGHSVGELVAAAVSGALQYEDALRFVALRARLMQNMPRGGMLAVRLNEHALRPLLSAALDLAAVNSPKLCVVAGPNEALEAFGRVLDDQQVKHKRLRTSHAFHSSMMDGAVAELANAARELRFSQPRIPYVSCVTGRWVGDESLHDELYFARHCRTTVRFADALDTACSGSKALLIEIGPGRTLSTFAAQTLTRDAYVDSIVSLTDGDDDAVDCIRAAVGGAWAYGLPVSFSVLSSGGRRVPLPTYPFERVTCWIDPPPSAAQAEAQSHAPTPNTPLDAEQSNMSSHHPVVSRVPRFQLELAALLQTISGSEIGPSDLDTNFLELGFDSLALGQVATRVNQQYKTRIGFRQLMSDFTSCAQLAAHLDTTLERGPETAAPAVTTQGPVQDVGNGGAASSLDNGPPSHVASGSLLEIFQAQLRAVQEVVAQQNKLLANGARVDSGTAEHSMSAGAAAATTTPAVSIAGASVMPPAPSASRFRQFDPKSAAQKGAIDAAQRSFIIDLSRRYADKTQSSRRSTEQYRAVLADPRAASGFRLEWKELCYPIVSARSKGSKLWDLDDNAYVDLVNGYGQTFLGHAPDFVQAAVAEQLAQGFAIGPQSPLAGEVASLLCEFVGMERVTFCNTGSEAVMAAMRVARCVTGRDKIAVFTNDYHGQFDEVLVRGRARSQTPTALPAAPGIPASSVANMLVLPYGSDDSLAYLREHMHELAAVVVEPVQSRHPELRPYAFLRELRAATAAAGTAFVFDEVVTGFRVHPGGMQALTGIRADMATYGKVVGGGLPVGILAGCARFMDALDGGQWRFGDDSFPEVAPTFFAGTFVRHPLVLAACKAVLLHLRQAGPQLQEQLAQRTAALVTRLNTMLADKGVAPQLQTFSSWFMPNFGAADPLGSLFYHHARLLGLHVQDGFPCFLTTAHDDRDLELIEHVFSQSVDALQAVGILRSESGRTPAPPTAEREVVARAPLQAPLTEVQREVWMAAQLGDAASCAFNESLSLRLEGPVNVDAVRAALNDVIARHDALRASFGTTGEHMQIAETLTLDVPLIDVSTELDPEAELRAILARDAATSFDLLAGPLVRSFAVRLANDVLTWVFTAHHIVCDGWSMNVILGELSQCYAARVADTAATLDPALSYARYARDLADDPGAPPHIEAFWLDQFKTIPTLPELPIDRQRPARRTYAGATHYSQIDAELYRAVKQSGARQGCTLFATLFAGFQLLAARLSDHADVVIAVPTAGQSLLEDQVLVGHCVNFLPLRVPIDWTVSFADHVKRVKQQLLAALDHRTYTLGTLVRKLELRRDVNRLPLTELQFNLERVGPNFEFPGARASLSTNPKAFSNYDLFFNVIESDAGLRIECDFNTDVFDDATIARWTGHFRTLLEEFVRDATRPLGIVPLLSTNERAYLLDAVNATAASYPHDVQLHQLIAAHAEGSPERVAAECGAVRLTFGELESRANQLARHLRQELGPASARVGVALDRSVEMLIALLAVQKAGHTYIPLDPDQPPERLRRVLETAEIVGLICDTAEIVHIAPTTAKVVRWQRAAAAVAAEEHGPLSPAHDASSRPAYVIFTSGSTGTPKGVEVSPRALVNFMHAMAKKPGFGSQDTLVAVTTVSFDIAALELFLPLMVGGRVVIASKDAVRSGFGLVDLIRDSRATVVQATPSLWRILLEARWKPGRDMKLLCGGEALPRDLADALLATGAQVWNMYGPTETTIWSSTGRVAPAPAPITIGDPIDNTQLHILDGRDQLLPVGATGQLYIGGDGLANGYLNRRDLTEAAFRDIALDGRAPQRLYRTGDLARRLADGSIQLLGRVDQQIKLRGFRIELEEIEAALRAAPGVGAAAVALQTGASGDPRLVGFFVPNGSGAPTRDGLMRHLGALLPDYMIPTAWQQLPKLPLTANGKLDRKALPHELEDTAQSPRDHAPPTTPMEIALSGIWNEVLGLANIGVRDSLFSLGADSLHLFRIAARMADRGIPLQVKHLLQHPTIADAARIAAGLSSNGTNGHAAAPSLRDFRHGARRGSRPA